MKALFIANTTTTSILPELEISNLVCKQNLRDKNQIAYKFALKLSPICVICLRPCKNILPRSFRGKRERHDLYSWLAGRPLFNSTKKVVYHRYRFIL
ncbi:hypothetical protein CEXT_103511 [Caerostris extrusa]|uniref:Uncharacterized protein n=1 Tax=Caerostris extrusa TaxID=172846 RepID=A0AAV4R302_CAEEX|nr:hypothetical protein CEXT_103511 [Caerostris extrusa]